MTYWACEDDIDFDMFTLSEFTDGQQYKPPRQRHVHPAPKTNGNNNNNLKSIYDFDDIVGLDAAEKQKIANQQLISAVGRGYVMQKFCNVNKSENVMPHRILDQTARDIREVNPLGYSNELIESAYKKPTQTDDATLKPNEQFRFSPSSDISNGAVPKKGNGETTASELPSTTNDLPSDFIEYETAPNLKLKDRTEFPPL